MVSDVNSVSYLVLGLIVYFALMAVAYWKSVFFRRTTHTALALSGKLVASVSLVVLTPLYALISGLLSWTKIAPVEFLCYRIVSRNIAKAFWVYGSQAIAAWFAVFLFVPMSLSQWTMRVGNIATTRMELIESRVEE